MNSSGTLISAATPFHISPSIISPSPGTSDNSPTVHGFFIHYLPNCSPSAHINIIIRWAGRECNRFEGASNTDDRLWITGLARTTQDSRKSLEELYTRL